MTTDLKRLGVLRARDHWPTSMSVFQPHYAAYLVATDLEISYWTTATFSTLATAKTLGLEP